MHSTNYYDTFIEIAEDCPAGRGEVPPERGGNKTVAGMQFDMLAKNPYTFSSDEVLFAIHAIRKEYEAGELDEQREVFFSKGQACFRASPLTKQYGWGLHSNAEGKIAIYGAETPEYESFLEDKHIKKVKAMRNKRK